MIRWYLEGFFQDSKIKTQQPMHDFPMIVGRDESLTCIVSAPSVSRNHAKISERDSRLWLEDLGSSNGTFVNRKPITDPVEIDHGDVIHFGSAEVRVIDIQHAKPHTDNDEGGGNETKFIAITSLSEQFPSGVRELEQLIADRAVKMVFQPIIKAPELVTSGYEILGRGASPDLPTTPIELFRIAESFELEVELSEVMRDKGVAVAVAHGLKGDLLVNTHPSEMKNPSRLMDSLTKLRKQFPSAPITLEIHEQCVTGNSDLLRSIKQKLDTLSMKLAFDDFGVGQSRFMDMVEAKPNLVKYDRVLIDGIDEGDESRIHLLRHLKELATELSINTLAECVSSEGEYNVCKTMGFEYYQGFYFAKPQPPENFSR